MSISVTAAENTERSRSAPEFSFLTNHGKTLLLIAHDPRIRMRDIARLLDITERRTQQIVADLAESRLHRARTRRTTQPLHGQHPPTPRTAHPTRHRHRIPARHPADSERLSMSGARLAGSASAPANVDGDLLGSPGGGGDAQPHPSKHRSLEESPPKTFAAPSVASSSGRAGCGSPAAHGEPAFTPRQVRSSRCSSCWSSSPQKNTHTAKLDWVVGSTRASLSWIILAAAIFGWLLGIATAVVVRRRTRRAN